MTRPTPIAYVLVAALLVSAITYLSRPRVHAADLLELTAEHRFKTWAELDERGRNQRPRKRGKMNEESDAQRPSARHPINPFPLRREDRPHARKSPLNERPSVPKKDEVVVEYIDDKGDPVGAETGLSVDYEQDGRHAQKKMSD
ncbi:MAG: hypothetical protein M1831_001224 [Alyxoria varia]|nr:MAG: hypothetical protein M1831_001224 [Alyxoria varia]